MYKVEITEASLRTGFNKRIDSYFNTDDEVRAYLKLFLDSRGIASAKLRTRYNMLNRGTAEGIKLFWSPNPGYRMYVWINIYEEKRLA